MKISTAIKSIQSYPLTKHSDNNTYSDIENYYNVAGPDYEMWSKHFNMHFGYCKRFRDIFFLENMLKTMNDEVLNRLQVNPANSVKIIDLGCGVGTVARHTATKFPNAFALVRVSTNHKTHSITNNQLMQIKNNFINSVIFPNNWFVETRTIA